MMWLTQANASAQRFGLIQWLEMDDSILFGQGVCLSARVRMSASTTLRYAIPEWTGTADTITKDIVNDWTSGTFTAGNFFTSTSTAINVTTGSTALTANTLTTISLCGMLGSSLNNLAVFFWTDSTQAQNVTLDISKVQLEVGTQPTSFARRPYQEELARCQRFFEAWVNDSTGYSNIATGALSGTNQAVVWMPLKVKSASRQRPSHIRACRTSVSFTAGLRRSSRPPRSRCSIRRAIRSR
jgi:hypothetical protein